MKKLLLATTALALSAGLANAQNLAVTGSARMGLTYAGSAPGPAVPAAVGTLGAPALTAAATTLESRVRIDFTATVAADHGLTMGAWTRINTSNAGAGTIAGGRVWVEGSGLRLTFGNQAGAIQGTLVGAGTVGYTGGGFAGGSAGMNTLTMGDSGAGGFAQNRIGVQYSAGDVLVMLSHDRAGTLAAGQTQAATEIGVRGTFGAVRVALGYATHRAITGVGTVYNAGTRIVTGSAAYNGGSWTAGLVIANVQDLGTNFALTASAQMGGGTLNGYIGRHIDGVAATSDNAYGIGYAYGLGGGARFAVGAESVNGRTAANVGVSFSF